MSVPWDPPKRYHAPLAPLVTSLMLSKLTTVTHVQLAPSTTCLPRRPAFPVAAPPPHLQVSAIQKFLDYSAHMKCFYLNNVMLIFIYFFVLCHICFLQVPLLVHVLVRTVHSSTQMVHVCAELVLSFTTNWISKVLHLTVNWTASLRSVLNLKSAMLLFCFYFFKCNFPIF